MLRLEIKATENFNEMTGRFVKTEATTLELEHSLASVSKWEAKYKIAFLSNKKMTEEQTKDYIRMMNPPGEFPESLFEAFTADDFNRVRLYIEEKMTATYVPETGNAPSGDVVTAELIYYWMIALGIPFECQHWNLDRLLTLIKVCNLKNDPKNAKKKTTTSDAIAQRRAINERRRRQLGSSG